MESEDKAKSGEQEASASQRGESVLEPFSTGRIKSTDIFAKANHLRVNEKHKSALRMKAMLVGVVSVGVAVAFWWWFVTEDQRQFPLLAPGSYVGIIAGDILTERPQDDNPLYGAQVGHTSFYIERAADTDELFVALLAPGWRPQLVSTVLPAVGGGSARWILPLIISRGSTRLQFTGVASPQGEYAGEVVELTTGKELPWTLRPIRSGPLDVENDAKDVRLWLLLKAELEDVEGRVREYERRVPEQRAEVDKLTRLLTEGEELRSRANEKFTEVRTELKKAESEYKAEQQEVRKLEQSLDIAQKVTGMGKLVSLSRESLEREWRIVDSLLRSSAGASAPDLDEEYERAMRALSLRDQVDAELQAIERLTAQHSAAADPKAQLRRQPGRPR